MKKYYIFTIIILFTAILLLPALALENLSEKLAGRILLQVENNGEAWYVNPSNQKRYFLGSPENAFMVMQKLGTGITSANLNKIPIGIISYDDEDSDADGLTNRFEDALGTDKNNADSDADGYSDFIEISSNNNPTGSGALPIDENFTKNLSGKIFLAVEASGEAWYIDSAGGKRYFLGRPSDALLIMRELSLGITNENLSKIHIGTFIVPAPNPPAPNPPPSETASAVFNAAAAAIRAGNKSEAVKYFIPEMAKAICFTLDFLDSEGRFTLGNIMGGAKLSDSGENECVYSTEVYFSLGGYKVPVNFYVKKQEDGSWKLTNL